MDIDELKEDIRKVYDLVKPDHFNILGGETFLYPDLIDLLLYIQEFDVEHVYVYTNGTINLDLSVLQHKLYPKVKFYIQHYPKSIAKDDIARQCQLYGFDYEIFTYNWTEYGNLEWCDDGETRFILCQRKCWTVLNGKLYMCPRAAHAHNLGKILLSPDKYVDLRGEDLPGQYNRFFYMKGQSTCSYCFIGSEYEKEISRGV
jgi:hypothetical protein